MINPFFKNNGPIKYSDILKTLSLEQDDKLIDKKINNISDLFNSREGDITFFHSQKYIEAAKNTKASYCITTDSLKKELSNS